MTFQNSIKAGNDVVGVSVTQSSDGLSDLHEAGNAAVVWNRRMPKELGTWLENLPVQNLPRCRELLSLSKTEAAITLSCIESGLPKTPERQAFIADVVNMAQVFAKVVPAPFYHLRLEAVGTNACRKFHIDTVKARLVCTFRGKGTQYGTSDAGGDPRHIYAVPTGSPIILRGSLYPESPSAGLLHRSPPIEGTGETRLVLVLNPISEFEDAA